MNLFVLTITYEKPLDEIDKILPLHREFLSKYYDMGILLASGPQNPRNGGVIIGKFKDKNEALEFSKNDPYITHNAASYHIMEFTPVKYSDILGQFLA